VLLRIVGSKGKEEQMSKQRDVEQLSRLPAGDDTLERRSAIIPRRLPLPKH
jgi:hypothetical protein